MFLNALWKISAFLFGILVFLSYVFYVFERRLSVLILAKRSKTRFVCCLWLFIVVENMICDFCFMQMTGLFAVRFRVRA